MKKGALYVASAYILWGFFPIYFKFLQAAPSQQIVGHRIVWSFLFLLLVIFLRREFSAFKRKITWRVFSIYLIAGVLLSINWLTYVWGVNAGFVVEASLGYFINPLVSILLGVIILHEKIRPAQWIPVGLAFAGVVYLTLTYGALPWIALVLAFSFGLYGLMKKIAPLGTLDGLVLETGSVFLPALGLLLFAQFSGVGAFGHVNLVTTLLLAFSGIITAVPLLLFANGARHVPLTVMGLLQYITPTLQFLIGVLIYGETFTHDRLIGFSIIWLALVMFSAENLINHRRLALAPAD